MPGAYQCIMSCQTIQPNCYVCLRVFKWHKGDMMILPDFSDEGRSQVPYVHYFRQKDDTWAEQPMFQIFILKLLQWRYTGQVHGVINFKTYDPHHMLWECFDQYIIIYWALLGSFTYYDLILYKPAGGGTGAGSSVA